MPITIDLPPAMIQEAQAFAESQHISLGNFISDALDAEFARRRKAKAVLAKLDAITERVGARLTGEPYKFNRADAYPEGEY